MLRLLTPLPYDIAVGVWLVITMGLYVGGVLLMLKTCPALDQAHRWLVVLLAVSFEPFLFECWLGGQCVLRRPRATPREGQRHARDIDYRHLVAALQRKPGAFARWVMRDAAFPRAVYRQTWERLPQRGPSAKLARRWWVCWRWRPAGTRRNWPVSWSS